MPLSLFFALLLVYAAHMDIYMLQGFSDEFLKISAAAPPVPEVAISTKQL